MKTMKMPTIDRTKKTITVTREFLICAGQYGTHEFNILCEMQKNLPGYEVVLHKITRNNNKLTYGDLTYNNMESFIKGHVTDPDAQKAAFDEYNIIKQVSKAMRGQYAYVKKWFLEKYKDEFVAYQKELERKKQEEDAPYAPIIPLNW